jgi:hypothetical protein
MNSELATAQSGTRHVVLPLFIAYHFAFTDP